MSAVVYKIRQALVIPLTMAVISLFALLLLSFFAKSLPGERFVLLTTFVSLAYLFLEALSRRVSLGVNGLEIGKFMRRKELSWADVTHAGALVIGKKVYALLTTTKGFIILSNNYERFSELVGNLCRHMGEERMDGELLKFIERPLINDKPVLSAWFLVLVLIAIITWRLFNF